MSHSSPWSVHLGVLRGLLQPNAPESTVLQKGEMKILGLSFCP